MNKVILMGRLTRDPETRYSQSGQQTAVTRYSLAVNRSYRREGDPEADFINIVAFGRAAEFAGKYFKKGMMVAVVGELRISSYDDRDGNRRWSTDVVVSEQHFAESRASFEGRGQGGSGDFAPRQSYNNQPSNRPAYESRGSQSAPPQPEPSYNQAPQGGNDGFMPIDDDIDGDEDLPF